MTQQLLYQAITSVLGATLDISDNLAEPRARKIRSNVNLLKRASAKALRHQDTQQLRALCDEVVRLGDAVKLLLKP